MTIADYTTRLLQLLGVEDYRLSIEESDDEMLVTIEVSEDQAGMLIGYHAETMTSLQRVLRLVFHEELGEKKLRVNINDYRQQREEQLVRMAEQAAHDVLETGEPYMFPYLPSNERFIIHSTISDSDVYADLETISDGEGMQRRLTVRHKISE